MSDYLASAWLAAQAEITPAFTDAEMRERQNPILRVGLGNQNFLMKDVEEMKKSTKRAVKGYQFKRKAATNGTTRSHNFTGTQGDTQEVTLNWSTYSEKFSIYMKSGEDNVKSNAQMLVDQMRQMQRIIRERLGAALVTALHTNRTQVVNGTVRNATWNEPNDAFEITNQDQMFAFMRSVMNQHKYYGNCDVIVDSILDPIARKIAAQGSANGTNLQYQLQGLNVMPHDILGTDVAVAAYPNGGLALALPQNSYAFIPFLEEVYRKSGLQGRFQDYNGAYSSIPDDTGLPVEYSLRGYTERADGSANGGTTDDMITHFQISADVAAQVAAMSTANETPVFEFALVG